ncbi:MAG: S53 family peptidase [Planctomycetaceae bacterium]|nr:S53 family peptidase [Planctomycetaceae bacterium]
MRRLLCSPASYAWRRKPGQHARSARRGSFRRLNIESLEVRALLSVSPLGEAVPCTVATSAADEVAMLSTKSPTGLTPTQVLHAYGFDKIAFNNGTVVGDGTGTTIAIVDAYDDPRIAYDLHQFNVAYGLPDTVFTKVNQYGGTAYPTANAGWAAEIALDVEWAHAIAPGANILLVEANSASYSDMLTAVNYARNYAGVVAVSMSWTGGDFASETTLDGYFTTPSNHCGVTFLAASGDTGAPVGYPAISPNVVAVGGTTLSIDSQGNYIGESGWSGSGGGLSRYERLPTYQRTIVTQSGTYRANPDVAYDSDPYSGFSVYDTYNNSASSPWAQWGGTSAAAPQWAALIAIADQGRMLAGKDSLDGASQTLPLLYSLSTADFHDITTGMSTGNPRYSAAVGFDLVTGRGSPVANLIVADLVGSTVSPPPDATPPVLSSVATGEASLQNGILESSEQGVITWAVNYTTPIASKLITIDGAVVTAVYGPFGPYDGGVYYCAGVFGPLAAGTHSYKIVMTDTNGLSATATGSFVVSAAAAPSVFSVAVGELSPQNGTLEANEQGVLTWALTTSAQITSKSLTLDGKACTACGPYGPYSGGVYYSFGIFNGLSAGTHTYSIQMTDANGLTGSATGSFVVVPAAAPIISSVAIGEAVSQNGVLESGELGVVTFAVTGTNAIRSRLLVVDGMQLAASYGPYGPYAGGAYYYAGVFPSMSAGSHNFSIYVTDSAGRSSSYNGTFSLAARAHALASVAANSAGPAIVAELLATADQSVERAAIAMPDRQIASSTDSPPSVADVNLASKATDADDEQVVCRSTATIEVDTHTIARSRVLVATSDTPTAERVELLDALLQDLQFVDGLLG